MELTDLLEEQTGGENRLTLSSAECIAEMMDLSVRTVELFAIDRGILPVRYEKNLGTIGVEGQRRLLESTAAIIGLGGLGGHVVESCARLGIGLMMMVDPDRFEESNLNRQILAVEESLGQEKAEAAVERTRQVNPGVDCIGAIRRVEQLGEGFFGNCSVVFDCLDSVPARHDLAGKCERAGVPLVHGAIAGWSGQVALCRPGAGLMEKLYAGDKRGLQRRQGNLPVTAAAGANLMVARAVPVLLGEDLPDRDEVLFFDLRDNEWQTVEV
jgi:molybdopterin/thiamine biosynthesis adenylyltransferase